MKFKRAIVLLIIGTSLLSGCQKDEDKISLLSNSDYVLHEDISDDNFFITPTVEEFSNLYNSNLNYIILFSDEDCSYCQSFDKIIKDYIKETHQMVFLVNDKNKDEINAHFKDKFFPDKVAYTPSLFIKENNEAIYKVDNESYMQTFSAFKRHMNSRYKTAKYSYFSGEITTKSWINREFTYLEFNANDIFKNNVYPLLISSQKDVLISYKKDDMYVRIIGRKNKGEFYTKNELKIDDKTSEENLKNFF